MVPHDPDTAKNALKNALRRDIDLRRVGLARDWADLRLAADLPSHLRKAVGKNTPAWLAGAGLAGFLLARRPGKRKASKRADAPPSPPPKPHPFWLAALLALGKWIFAVGGPIAAEIAKKKLLDLARRNP